MAGAGDDGQPVLIDRVLQKRWIVDAAFDEAELSGTVDHGFGGLRSIADGELDLDLWVGVTESDQARRQPIACNGLAGMDAECAAFETAHFRQREFGGGCPGENRAGFA